MLMTSKTRLRKYPMAYLRSRVKKIWDFHIMASLYKLYLIEKYEQKGDKGKLSNEDNGFLLQLNIFR